MTKKNFMRWKLPQLPNAEDIAALVQQKVITAEEAREILFSSEEKTDSNTSLNTTLTTSTASNFTSINTF